MWIVDVALRRPYTFIVMALLLPLFGFLALQRMAVDIFPKIPIPILAAVWSYSGLPADEVAYRITSNYERGISTTVNDVEHIDSTSVAGMGVIKVYLHPGANVEKAQSQMVATSQSTSRQMPPGISPPMIVVYDASNVPVLQVRNLDAGYGPLQVLFDVEFEVKRGEVVAQGLGEHMDRDGVRQLVSI